MLDSELWGRVADDVRQATTTLDYRPAVRPAPRPTRSFLRVAAWNVERGRNLGGIIDVLRSDPVLCDVDLLLVCEADRGVTRSGNRDTAAEIAEALGFECAWGACYVCLGGGGSEVSTDASGLAGNAVLSRYPLVAAQNVSLAITKDKFQSSEKRLGHKKAVWAEAHTPIGRVRAAATHLDAFASRRQRRDQLADLLDALDDGAPPLTLLGGDLNTTSFDMSNGAQSTWDLVNKCLSGGLGHVLHHYLHPFERYERGLFADLEARGFAWQPFNALGLETFRYTPGAPAERSALEAKMPSIIVRALVAWFARHGGTARGRLDWLVGRGLEALDDGTRVDANGRRSAAPTVRRIGDRGASDHDPIVADVALPDGK